MMIYATECCIRSGEMCGTVEIEIVGCFRMFAGCGVNVDSSACQFR